MRLITFTDHLQVEVTGQVIKNAICLGDVDNDGLNELIIGNDKGDIFIFKDEEVRPVRIAKSQGMVSAISVGDILNEGRNFLLIVTACGHLSIYDFKNEDLNEVSKNSLLPIHTQSIPGNVKVSIIGDINGDGLFELVVGLTDRVVRTYRWTNAASSIGENSYGRMIALNKWEFAEQIGTLTFHKMPDGRSCILVSQSGGIFISLQVDPMDQELAADASDEYCGQPTKINLDLEPMVLERMRNAEIVGNVSIISDSNIDKDETLTGENGHNFDLCFAAATLDGTLMLVGPRRVRWYLSLMQHQFFSLANLDVTGDGEDEVVACTWDGNTVIVKDNEYVQFNFKDSVSAFTAGSYGFRGKPSSCLIYVTFRGRIYIYYNVKIPAIQLKSVKDVLHEDKTYTDFVKSLNIKMDESDKLRELNRYLLYGCK